MTLSPTAFLAAALGLLTAAVSAVGTDGRALAAAAVAAVAVLVGMRFRSAATVAVVACACAIAIADPAPAAAVLAGLCAAGYLVIRHASGSETVTLPTIIGAVALSLLTYLATIIPLDLAWLPLAAPLAVFGLYVIVVRPLFVG